MKTGNFMKAVLIDDEPLSRDIIKSYLKKHPGIEIAEECNDGFEGVKAIAHHKPDLVFLDIQMPKINGFEMLELIEEQPHIIFTTAFDEYALQAFEKNAVDYLLKPFSQDRFDKAIQKLGARPDEQLSGKLTQEPHPGSSGRIVVKTGTKVKIIPVQEIIYLKSDDDFVVVHTAEGSFMKNKTMQFYEDSLDPEQFTRVHRSYMVNIQHITRLDRYKKETHLAILRNGEKIPVSLTGYTKLKTVLGI